ncbi:hypothetical protein [Chondrinema litorale]|uniref:hypothetical protein n=1 Tax=Chondrinema litorale TaxID=2994555 RepID=UPI0025434F84|nr:hypothetical protein [Chondrinema litorale]UZR93640.1 hypothetical protein OQ292_17460 [Chondrinema litorale]
MKTWLVLAVLFFGSQYAFSEEIVLTGYYYGTNLYVQNPKIGDDQYCISRILVNDKEISPIPKNSSFDIDMAFVANAAPVEIRIIHSGECKPDILNEGVIKKRESFSFVGLDIGESYIKWQARGERVYGKYFIRRFEKNNWLTIHAIDCNGSDGVQQYQYDVRHFSGDNKYQVKYLDSSGRSFTSDDLEFSAVLTPVAFSPEKVKKEINFSRKTQYRIMDISGKVILQGYADLVDCANLQSGVYYVAFEDQIRQFTKK